MSTIALEINPRKLARAHEREREGAMPKLREEENRTAKGFAKRNSWSSLKEVDWHGRRIFVREE